MKTFKELLQQQDELDEEELVCPRCKKDIASWYEVREFGGCGDCIEKENNNE